MQYYQVILHVLRRGLRAKPYTYRLVAQSRKAATHQAFQTYMSEHDTLSTPKVSRIVVSEI